MAEKHWRVVSDDDNRVLIDRKANGTDWESITFGRTWYDLAFDPSGKLYGLDQTGRLRLLDLDNGSSTLIGNPGASMGEPNAFVIDALGNGYIASKAGGIFKVDLDDGSVERLGAADARSEGDLEFVKGELWLSTTDNKLVHIDTKTGQVIEEFSHGIANLCGLSLTADGFLGYAGNSIYRIDLSDEKLTKIGEIDGIETALGADSLPTDYYLSPTGRNFTTSSPDDITIVGNARANKITAGSGDNKVLGGKGDDTVDGRGGNDRLLGQNGNDRLKGGSGNDRLDGGRNNDRLFGQGGEDRLFGNSGRDKLIGGAGKDALTGGADTDTFVFLKVSDSTSAARDVVRDFQTRVDKIDLSRIDADTGASGNNAFTFIGRDTFDGEAGQLRFKSGVLRGDVDGDGAADLTIELAGITKVVAGDFIL